MAERRTQSLRSFRVYLMPQSRLSKPFCPIGAAVANTDAVDFTEMHGIHHACQFFIRFRLSRDMAMGI